MPSTQVQALTCWSHPGSYLQDVGIQILTASGTFQRLYLQSGEASKGFTSIRYNDQDLEFLKNPLIKTDSLGLRLISTHEVEVTVEDFILEIENIDYFVNLRLIKLRKPLSQLRSHGLIGQTWRTTTYKGRHKYTEGVIDDYIIAENDVFGSDFPYNQFGKGVREIKFCREVRRM
jgi:hypothetical protein